MKRKGIVSVVGALLLACALSPGYVHASGASDTGTAADQSEVEPILRSRFQLPLEPIQWPQLNVVDTTLDNLTLREKIEAFLGDEDDYPDGIWYYHDTDRTWVEIDNEYYCVGAVYPSEKWTPVDVAASYTERSAPWTEDLYSNRLWSPDYEHKFTVEYHHNNSIGKGDDWLYIDGYRAWPLNRPVGDISPENMIRLYQSGEWNGEDRVYSEECPGLVVDGIDYSGALRYSYDVKEMTDETAVVADALLHSWDHVYPEHYDRAQTRCKVFIYPDHPDPYDLSFRETHRDSRGSSGTYFIYLEIDDSKNWARCTGAQVVLYEQGKLIQSWDLTPEKEFWGSYDADLIYKDGECYVFHYDTLWHLLPNGSVELVLDGIIGSDYFWDSTVVAFYTRSGDVAFIPPLSDEELERLDQELSE